MTILPGIYYTHTLAQIATLLGMNFDSTNNVMYKGSNTTTGFKISSFSSSSTQANLIVNGTNTYQGYLTSGKNLKYQQIEGGGYAFSFSTDAGILDMIVTKYKNTIDDTYGNCYLICSTKDYIAFDDMTDKVVEFYSPLSLSSPFYRTPVTSSSSATTFAPITSNIISIAPLVIQHTSTNARIIQGVYLPATFPSGRSGYTEFELNNDKYISLNGSAGSVSNGKFIVKEVVA